MTVLADIPDMQGESFETLTSWIKTRIDAIAATDFTPDVTDSFVSFELHQEYDHPCGPEAFPEWRRFFLATLLADWACYETPVDRIDLPRLKYIMSSAHRHFRVWFCRLADGMMTPVGYSAWYPIAKFVHDAAIVNPDGIDDRGAFLPLRFVKPEAIRYGYALNVSIVKPLRNTPFSRRVIRAYQRDAALVPNMTIMAVTVDEAGRKFSRMTQFAHHGDITVQGEVEGLFVKRG